jgi:hypothetical protein
MSNDLIQRLEAAFGNQNGTLLGEVIAALSTPADGGEQAVAWMHPIHGGVIRADQRIEGVTLTDFNIPLGVLNSPAANIQARDGWVMVPVESTEEMLRAWQTARKEWDSHAYAQNPSMAGYCYRAMLAASPTPPQQQEQSGEAVTVARTCSECGLGDIAIKVECHNSACKCYSDDRTVYEGWKSTSPAKSPDTKVQHDSDCSLHNGPAYEPGPCDCSVSPAGSSVEAETWLDKAKPRVVMNGREIHDLALYAGFSIVQHDYQDEFETEFVVADCPESGVLNDDNYIAAGEPGKIRALVDGWNTGDRLCEYKAKDIASRGYKHCGYVLRNDQDEYCFINAAAVRWLSKDECWQLMHPDAYPVPARPLGEDIGRLQALFKYSQEQGEKQLHGNMKSPEQERIDSKIVDSPSSPSRYAGTGEDDGAPV